MGKGGVYSSLDAFLRGVKIQTLNKEKMTADPIPLLGHWFVAQDFTQKEDRPGMAPLEIGKSEIRTRG